MNWKKEEQLVEQKALRRKTGSHGKSGRTSRLKKQEMGIKAYNAGFYDF